MKYVYLLTKNSLVKVGVLRKLFRKLAIGVYNGVHGAGMMQPLNKALSVFIFGGSACVEIPPKAASSHITVAKC